MILHRRVQKRKRKIYAGVVIICHIFKPRVPNCGFSVVPSLLDCLHRGLQTVMELYSEKVRLTATYFLFFPVFFFFPAAFTFIWDVTQTDVLSAAWKLNDSRPHHFRGEKKESRFPRTSDLGLTRRRAEGSFNRRAGSWLLDDLRAVFCRPALGYVMWSKSRSCSCWNTSRRPRNIIRFRKKKKRWNECGMFKLKAAVEQSEWDLWRWVQLIFWGGAGRWGK